jgi:hypothetical protein
MIALPAPLLESAIVIALAIAILLMLMVPRP